MKICDFGQTCNFRKTFFSFDIYANCNISETLEWRLNKTDWSSNNNAVAI